MHYKGLEFCTRVNPIFLTLQTARPDPNFSFNFPILTAGVEGAAISLLNPKLAIFFIALFSPFVSPDATLSDQLIMTATALLVDSIVVFLLSHGPILKTLQNRSQLVNRLTGGILIALAARVVTL
ncbi:LysE family translocator [Amphritea pacifica]|uniref:LysE family translocator n=1 Tax=Amphritea pacifica TaxID=2811233 RepID=UPI001E53542C|nr:LysE family transporter [Amphritea pacifica]